VAELVWKGKGRAGRSGPGQLSTDEIHGGDAGWRNRLVLGDAERILPALGKDVAGRVSLVYVDPPFDTGGAFDYQADIPGAAARSASGPRARVAIPAYRDARGLDAWLGWFAGMATELRELLADGGSLYVHLDAHVAHYAKVVLDEVFGLAAFQREIVWRIGWISGFKSRARGWIRNHDTILFYAKGGRPLTFNKEYVPYPDGYLRRDGAAPTGKGYPVDDVWNGSEIDRLDSIQIMSFSGEKVGYPTQKNEALVARIVRASSNPGDLVLDCCAGSGTTAVVASKLGRRWVACDASPIAIHVARKRLGVLAGARPFVVERDARAVVIGGRRKVGVRVAVEQSQCTLTLTSYSMPRHAALAASTWSQQLEGWSVDWDSVDDTLRVGSSLWKNRRGEVPCSATHRFEHPGRYRVRIRAYDLLGGHATRVVPVHIR
jgi:16S rRNA G966 N2-methylase RsmD